MCLFWREVIVTQMWSFVIVESNNRLYSAPCLF